MVFASLPPGSIGKAVAAMVDPMDADDRFALLSNVVVAGGGGELLGVDRAIEARSAGLY